MRTTFSKQSVYLKQTSKVYACKRCGHETRQTTNHYGATWSFGRVNACPRCPPWAKFSEFGGQTLWICKDSPPRPILWLEHNGDPYGSGFTASESTDGGESWFYRGDVGAMPRAWWRNYARRNGHTLREA